MHKIIRLVSFLLLTSCAQLDLAVVNLPTHFDQTEQLKDIVYNDKTQEKLDIYRPSFKADALLPIVVFFHGGRWQEGSKDYYPFIGSAFAERGYITVIPDYRKYPSVKFPTFVDDAAAVLAWVEKHSDEFGGDKKRIYVLGHSAGAHIGALVAADPHYLRKYGQNRSLIKAFAGLAGPYSFTPDEPDLIEIFGPPSNYPKMQVTSFIDGHEPPMLLLWGNEDTAVKKYNLDKLAQRIKKKHGCVETEIYPETDHLWIIANISWLGGHEISVLDDVVSFFQKPRCQ